MDRRLVIAFVLSTALILSYQFFYYGPRMKKYQEAKRQAELIERARLQAQQEADSLAALLDDEPEGEPAVDVAERIDEPSLAPPPDAPEGLPAANPETAPAIIVESDLYRIVLSTAGGEIISARLLRYTTDHEPVELVNYDPARPLGAGTITLKGDRESLSLSDVRFEAYYPLGAEPLLSGTEIRLSESSPEREVEFRVRTPDGGQITRRYKFTYGSYMIGASVRLTASSYPFVRDIAWGFGPGMRATEQNTNDDYGAFRTTVRLGDEYRKKKMGDFAEAYSGNIHWGALQTKYFTMIMIPPEPVSGEAQAASVKVDHLMTASLELPTLERGGRIQQNLDLYIGPLDFKLLGSYDRGLNRLVDIGFEHFKIFKPVSRGILESMLWLHKYIPNYGLIIIIISVLTKVLFYRLTHKSFKSMRDMQALQPKMQALKERYKDDRQKMSQETMKLYKEAGVNPLGGCLPMLLQMPVFIALFNVLRNTIELRRAPFVGWINDLSQQDVLFRLPFALPVMGDAFSVMPILMGGSMFLQSKIGGGIAGPSSSATQPKAMMYMLPIVFTVLFYRMPSGLVLYWLINTVLSVAQQYYINKGADTPQAGAVDDPDTKLKTPKPGPATPAGDGAKPKPKPNRPRRKGKSRNRQRKG